ncbi:hypothetical protein NQ314_004342 [Rhamnusium bicolor]|uniref:Uncharacterized protein n=1 Tax=Rhamnusium bicolor TaxID=1586634 RepID=A0AAV8ZK46_9CUCU|nr:hypothetical protein NQ314_004342 [Rhamnusium bicolor]
MVALKEAMQDDEREEALKNSNSLDRFSSRSNKNYPISSEDVRSMERRGHGNMGQQKGRIYWRCYFNAVTCF